MVFVGCKDQILHSFQQAGWLLPDPITLQTSEKIAVASLVHRSYPTAPVSNLSVFGRVQDLAFEKPTNDVQNRGHIRLWKTGRLISGQLVWVGQASYDSGIELSGTNHLPTHHIAPTVDLERNAVGSDLEKTGLVTEESDGAFTPPILYARNGGGDYYESDGDVLVINYTHAPIQLTKPAGMIDELKNGFFFFYDTLLTALPLALAVGMLGLRRRTTGAGISDDPLDHYQAQLETKGVSVATQQAARSDLTLFCTWWETKHRRAFDIYASVRVQETCDDGGGNFSYGQVTSPKTRSQLRPMQVDEGEYHLRQAAAETCPVFPAPGNSHAGSFLAHRSSPSIVFLHPATG